MRKYAHTMIVKQKQNRKLLMFYLYYYFDLIKIVNLIDCIRIQH